MDTSKPITYQQVAAASDAELATLTTRHAKELHRRWALEHASDTHYSESDGDPDKNYAIIRLKALLDTRPHVPNKKEAKAARQAAAKRGR